MNDRLPSQLHQTSQNPFVFGEVGNMALSPFEPTPMPPEREVTLRRLLDPPVLDAQGRSFSQGNFDYALESGLIGVFDYDAPTGRDGVMHLLVGEIEIEASGRLNVQGFHVNHDPEFVQDAFGSSENAPDPEQLSAKYRRRYVDRIFEPRKTPVTIMGHQKYRAEQDDNGKNVVVPVDNTMFPREYDPLAAMQAIRIARDTRDRSQDTVVNGLVVSKSTAPMIDGITPMPVVVVMTPEEKVVTAFPCAKESGFMKLTDTAIDYALRTDG